jgi:hypothetical protein
LFVGKNGAATRVPYTGRFEIWRISALSKGYKKMPLVESFNQRRPAPAARSPPPGRLDPLVARGTALNWLAGITPEGVQRQIG